MLRKIIGILVLFSILAVPAMAQDDLPTVAIIRFGPLPPFELSQEGFLDTLEAYGYVDGENINIIFGDADFDFSSASLLIEDAIDEGAGAIVTITTPVTQAAVTITSEMAEPPIILFNTVTDPYAAGIAQASCIKPDYVTGSQALAPYSEILPLVFDVLPEIETVGYIYNTSEANAVASTEIIVPLAEELGITLDVQAVTSTAEAAVAADTLGNAGVEAFFIPTDSIVSDALPAILTVAEEVGIPLFHADSAQATVGATVASGVDYYQEGIDTALMYITWLEGDTDIATTGISMQLQTRVGINLDSAASQGVAIPQELIDSATFIVEGGEVMEAGMDDDMEMMVDREADMAFVESLACTEERIAEQQAMLDAGE